MRPVVVLLLLALSASLPACRSQEVPASKGEAKKAASEAIALSPQSPVVAEAPDVAEALVVGLRDDKGSLSTLFVDAKGFSVLGQGVAVPRDDGWWKLDRRRDRDASGKNSADTLYASSDPAWRPPANPFEEMESCESAMSVTVLFVGFDHVSYEHQSSGYCEGAAHPFGSARLHTVSLQDLAGKARSLPIDELLEAPALAGLRTAGSRALEGEECLNEPDPTDWALVRRQGKWVARGRLNYAAEACRGAFKDFTVPGVSPRNLTGHDALPMAWTRLQKKVPKALDALASPSKRLVVFVTAEGLVLEVDGSEVARHAAPGHSVVLSQWAEGRENVERWRTEAGAVLK